MADYKSLVSSGIVQPLGSIAFHENAPLLRRLMAGGDLHPGANLHVAVHEIRGLANESRHYSTPHRHTCGELNLVLSDSYLAFNIQLDDEQQVVEAPASIYIPPGVLHSANVIEGTGYYIAIIGCNDYTSSFAQSSVTDGETC